MGGTGLEPVTGSQRRHAGKRLDEIDVHVTMITSSSEAGRLGGLATAVHDRVPRAAVRAAELRAVVADLVPTRGARESSRSVAFTQPSRPCTTKCSRRGTPRSRSF